MSDAAGRHIIIVGGGASGVLLAYQLLSQQAHAFRVTLIEQRQEIGRGIAYHTGNPDHLLNVRVANMSALPDQPDHFWRWLTSRNMDMQLCPDPYGFVPRRIYGDYISSLLKQQISDRTERHLSIVQGTCVEIAERDTDLFVTINDGRRFAADFVVLATGHDTRTGHQGFTDPWTPPSDISLEVDAAVLILGTGLTMVDYVLSLLRDGHRGTITAISRRGLLARPHRHVKAIRIEEAEVPLGANISTLLRWLRGRIDTCVAQGGDWRSVIDGLRPYTQRLWRELPPRSKRSFIEHARAWWDVHRHRMAPEVEMRIMDALHTGKLSLMAAKVLSVKPTGSGAEVTYRRRGEMNIQHIEVATVVDCTGIVNDPRVNSNPALRSLLEQGLARADPLRIGIETDDNCAIVDRDGVSSRRLFAIGPLTRATFWEVIAIPDIRTQCAEFAVRLARAAAER
jgi:uncharacterized NAD(P)/FAD-binding protein YdhS